MRLSIFGFSPNILKIIPADNRAFEYSGKYAAAQPAVPAVKLIAKRTLKFYEKFKKFYEKYLITCIGAK